MSDWTLRILEQIDELKAVEELQRLVWSGNETEIIPIHMLVAAVQNGGLAIGAFPRLGDRQDQLIGFVFGFPGLVPGSDGPEPFHCSHMLAVHPDYRDLGLGFALKRAQWQMVRHQKLNRITWTYDPLQSRNAFLNIAKLGAVCNRYHREYYGEMRDGLNAGLPSDRFEVDWWVKSRRVERRLSRRARLRLDLAHFLAAGAVILNPTEANQQGWPRPVVSAALPEPSLAAAEQPHLAGGQAEQSGGKASGALWLVEIPADFQGLRAAEPDLALEWRLHSRALFEDLFERGYLVTDFVYLPGTHSRSFYVLSHGEYTF